ncbi:MAG TPA: enoyl-CoA hydratase-related protein [Vicinamibacterales bacterium]|nr:enoyl-CoA hydratase-related protein [Vicinamibacterales bacterium]
MITHARDERVARLTLARADKRNALSASLLTSLLDGLRDANADASVGAILIDAEGPAFSAGMDLEEAPSTDPQALNQLHAEVFSIRKVLTKPLVAAVDGTAFGGAVGLVANAHVAIASEQARFGLVELRIGMWPFMIWASVVAAIGERRAIELALTTRVFSAAEALSYGLVHEVTPQADLARRASEVARQLSTSSGETIARGLRSAAHPELGASLRAEQLASPDFREGVSAFREKRPPRWPQHS